MDYTIGDTFPDFSTVAVDIDNELVNIDVLQKNMWTVVYFYPKDFTFICPTEIAAMDKGRNAEEILRTLQALKAGGLTGCAWQPGDDFVA